MSSLRKSNPYKDSIFLDDIKKFMSSYSIYDYLPRLNPMYMIPANRDMVHKRVRNNQQPVPFEWALLTFEHDFSKDFKRLNIIYKRAFRAIIDEQYLNKFFDTFDEYMDYIHEKMVKIEETTNDELKQHRLKILSEILRERSKQAFDKQRDIGKHALNQELVKEYDIEKSLKYEPETKTERDIVKDCKAYRDKHFDELRVIQSNIKFDVMSRRGRPLDGSSMDTMRPVAKIIQTFISKGYQISDTKDIIQTLGFTIDDEYIDLVKKMVRAVTSKKQTKKQEVKQYPPRYTTSKPSPIVDITSTDRPKLNLSHIHQVHQPASVSPSENTRAKGQIEGLEEDKRIWNSEKDLYLKAWQKIGDNIDKVPHKTNIHATNDIRAAVKKLKHGTTIGNRLVGWR